MAKVKYFRCRVSSISPQRQQYRPYLYELLPDDLYVDIVVPEDGIVEEGKDGAIVLTMDGFSATLGRIADSLDAMHKQHEFKLTGRR